MPEAKAPIESEVKMEKIQILLTRGICLTGNHVTANLLGEFIMKVKPKPVMKVPISMK